MSSQQRKSLNPAVSTMPSKKAAGTWMYIPIEPHRELHRSRSRLSQHPTTSPIVLSCPRKLPTICRLHVSSIHTTGCKFDPCHDYRDGLGYVGRRRGSSGCPNKTILPELDTFHLRGTLVQRDAGAFTDCETRSPAVRRYIQIKKEEVRPVPPA